jgi:putative DNA primase/helicase
VSLIFRDHAPLFNAAGLSVIPVNGKIPNIKEWSRFCDRMPTQGEHTDFLRDFPWSNIGLCTGPASGVIALDVDTDEDAYIEAVKSVLPDSPWVRIGRQGFACAFRFNGETQAKLYLKDNVERGNKPILELLAGGRQLVVPPSIHPVTRRVYSENVPLHEVMDKLGYLPKDFMDRLMAAFEQRGIPVSFTPSGREGDKYSARIKLADKVPAGGRDIAMTKLAGELAIDIRKGEITLIGALAVADLWHRNSIEMKAGDGVDPVKTMSNIIRFLLQDVKAGATLPEGWDEGVDEETRIAYGLDKIEKGSIRRDIGKVKQEFEEASQGSLNADEVVAAIDQLLEDLARSDKAGSLEEVTLIKRAAALSNKLYTAGELKKLLKDRRAEIEAGEAGEAGEDHHYGVAEAILGVVDAVQKAPYANGALWEWDGVQWQRWGSERLSIEVGARFGSKLKTTRKAGDLGQVAKLALSMAQRQCEAYERPKLPSVPGVCFANGILTEDGDLIPHAPEYGFTYVLPMNYEREASCDGWLALLKDYWGEDEDYLDKIKALREAFAIALFGLGPKFERSVCLTGSGKNGKSTILKVLEGLFPPHLRAAVSVNDFGERFALVALDGRLINIGQEIREGSVINDKVLKEVVSGNPVEVEQKGQPRYVAALKAMHFFGTNNVPRVAETSAGLQRRFLMLEFRRQFEEHEIVRDIDKQILVAEKEGIVAWAVGALPKDEITLPESHKRLMRQFVHRNNSVLAWLDSRRVKKEGAIDEEAAYVAYKSYCIFASTQPVRLERFCREMEAMFRRDDGKYLGLSVP